MKEKQAISSSRNSCWLFEQPTSCLNRMLLNKKQVAGTTVRGSSEYPAANFTSWKQEPVSVAPQILRLSVDIPSYYFQCHQVTALFKFLAEKKPNQLDKIRIRGYHNIRLTNVLHVSLHVSKTCCHHQIRTQIVKTYIHGLKCIKYKAI
jgi:hypothetical protein